MTIEHAASRALAKPWGSSSRAPWSSTEPGRVIGEIWFDRPAQPPHPEPSLLLKLLFTRQPLSIQVHPDDAMAHRLGQPNGKTEAWYVLDADADATLARGLGVATSEGALRDAIADGSIRDRVHWLGARKRDTIAIPAGTIHALGAGLVVAELQQRSDTTFRLFDFGRGRELQIDLAVAAAVREPSAATAAPRRLTPERLLLVACPQFVFERLELPANTGWEIAAAVETWILVIDGDLTIGTVHAGVGEAVFLERDRALLTPGAAGATALVGMLAAAPTDDLLTNVTPSPLLKALA